MKIRSDFVTNSSSTAFVLVKKQDLTLEGIRELLGIAVDSPLDPIAQVLFERLDRYGEQIDEGVADLAQHQTDAKNGTRHFLETNFSSEVASKVQAAKESGASVLMGQFSSDIDEIECFLCCESFELENDNYYLNAIECSW